MMVTTDLDLNLPCKVWRTELVDATFQMSTNTQLNDDFTGTVVLSIKSSTVNWCNVIEMELLLNVPNRGFYCETFVRNLQLLRRRLLRYSSREYIISRWDPAKVMLAEQLGCLLITKLAITKIGWFGVIIFQPVNHSRDVNGASTEQIRVLFAADEIRSLIYALKAETEKFSSLEQDLLDMKLAQEQSAS